MEENGKVEIGENEGAIIFREEGPTEYVFPGDTVVDTAAAEIRIAIAYFIYASSKNEWVKEFNEVVQKISEDTQDKKKDKKDRSHLRVIK